MFSVLYVISNKDWIIEMRAKMNLFFVIRRLYRAGK